MNKKSLWSMVSVLMALSLVMAACAPAATPTAPTTPTTPTAPTTPTTPTKPAEEKTQKEAVAPTADVPKYGGTLTLSLSGDQTNFDPSRVITSIILNLTNEELWGGDWARGIAGGYGTKETDWGAANNDLWYLKLGYIAESTKWTVDEKNNEGILVYQIRQGVRFALNPASEASRLVNGRTVTADDVIWNMKRVLTEPTAFLYATTELWPAKDKMSKTGPSEITIKVPLDVLSVAIARFSNGIMIVPPEVVAKYKDMQDWKNSVGTGSFMLKEYVPGSAVTLSRNPNFWMKDPIGPGKGNQLPYLDGIKVLIIPDASTRQAAFRTGKIDQMTGLTEEDAAAIRKTTTAVIEKSAQSYQGRGTPLWMDTRKPPFNDVRVRRAMMMAIDFNSILQNLFKGRGQIHTVPYAFIPEYADLYLGWDDPKFPESARELYTYNPDKARQLLKDAGYPTGFKTTMILDSTEVDYYSIIKDMWSKVGIDLTLDLKTSTIRNNLRSARQYELVTYTTGPIAMFVAAGSLWGTRTNFSYINDPYVGEMVAKFQRAALDDLHQAMKIQKELRPYLLDQAYSIPNVIGYFYWFWWPWLKNYSGELTLGYDTQNWPQWIWYDQTLKKSMGY